MNEQFLEKAQKLINKHFHWIKDALAKGELISEAFIHFLDNPAISDEQLKKKLDRYYNNEIRFTKSYNNDKKDDGTSRIPDNDSIDTPSQGDPQLPTNRSLEEKLEAYKVLLPKLEYAAIDKLTIGIKLIKTSKITNLLQYI